MILSCICVILHFSLANVLLHTPATTPCDGGVAFPSNIEKRKLSGLMGFMLPSHIQILLSCLDVSYDRAIEFDSRPGLKFLVQKVANLERAANLYRQAGAAWTLKVVTLFDLCLHEVGRNGVTLERVKLILEDDGENESDKYVDGIMQKPGTPATYDYGDMTVFLKRLRQSFDKLCETYVDVVLDKDGQHTAVDNISDQPIFFLIAQPDDFPEIKRKESLNRSAVISVDDKETSVPATEIDEKVSVSSCEKSNVDKKDVSVGSENVLTSSNTAENCHRKTDEDVESSLYSGDEDVFEPSESNVTANRPFALADFARQYSSSSDSEAEVKLDTNVLCEGSAAKDEGFNDAVYNVASEKDIEGLMGEYKKHKQIRAMPPSHGEKRRNPFTVRGSISCYDPPLPSEPVPLEIEQQRRSSLFRVGILFVK